MNSFFFFSILDDFFFPQEEKKKDLLQFLLIFLSQKNENAIQIFIMVTGNRQYASSVVENI